VQLRGLVALIFNIYTLILLARIVLSWMPLTSQRGPAAEFARVVYSLTEPLLRPIRNALRPYQGSMPLDFSPMLLFLLLSVIQGIILRFL
jgi:YggT family protein